MMMWLVEMVRKYNSIIDMELKEMIAVMQAAQEGKKIECRRLTSENWIELIHPHWDWEDCEYRVKPETKVRPYANAKEFLEAKKEHGPYVYQNGVYDIVSQIHNYGVMIDKADVSYRKLLEYQWQDGTPCGVQEW